MNDSCISACSRQPMVGSSAGPKQLGVAFLNVISLIPIYVLPWVIHGNASGVGDLPTLLRF